MFLDSSQSTCLPLFLTDRTEMNCKQKCSFNNCICHLDNLVLSSAVEFESE